MALLGYNPF